jgi:hypothetical protein
MECFNEQCPMHSSKTNDCVGSECVLHNISLEAEKGNPRAIEYMELIHQNLKDSEIASIRKMILGR